MDDLYHPAHPMVGRLVVTLNAVLEVDDDFGTLASALEVLLGSVACNFKIFLRSRKIYLGDA